MDISTLEQEFQSQGETVLQQLDEWVQSRADHVCIYYGEEDKEYSFRDFDNLCNSIANGLAALGVSKGDRVSVLSKNAFITSIAMFAAWKLGALYCPINNAYKGELLAYIINDTQAKVLLADSQFIDALNAVVSDLERAPQLLVYQPEQGAHDYDASIDAMAAPDFFVHHWGELLTCQSTRPAVTVSENDLANIIYTSGTTGHPKGVVQNHKWIHGYIFYALKSAHADNVIHSDLPLYHVGGAMLSVAGAVWAGNRLALWDRFSPEKFWERIRKSGATHALLVDTMISWLMDAPPSELDRQHSLKMVNMTPLPANHNAVARRFGIDFVQTGYGSTELGVGFVGLIDELGAETVKPPQWEKAHSRERIRELHDDIGGHKSLIDGSAEVRKGFMGSVASLVEAKLLDSPAGDQAGQIAFRHKLPGILFREYFNKPEATQRAMQGEWYVPNDIVSVDAEGIYYFEDRQQGFIRVRGENLSASTVEQQFQKHPAVSHCAVVGVAAEEGDEQDIAAFIVLKKNTSESDQTLQQWAREQLPKFMWPKHLRIVQAMPVTPTFKVEKYKLAQALIEELATKKP